MRYESKSDLPHTLRDALPEEAQRIYLKAYQEAWDKYSEEESSELDQEGVAHRQAMHAVEEEFVLREDMGGWFKRGEVPEEEEEGGVADEVLSALDDIT